MKLTILIAAALAAAAPAAPVHADMVYDKDGAPLLSEDGVPIGLPPYFFQQIRKDPRYKTALETLVRGQDLPEWIEDWLKTGNGVDTPRGSLTVAGQEFELYRVCHPHDCPNYISMLYSPGGRLVWAAVKWGETITAIGCPGRELSALMIAEEKRWPEGMFKILESPLPPDRCPAA